MGHRQVLHGNLRVADETVLGHLAYIPRTLQAADCTAVGRLRFTTFFVSRCPLVLLAASLRFAISYTYTVTLRLQVTQQVIPSRLWTANGRYGRHVSFSTVAE